MSNLLLLMVKSLVAAMVAVLTPGNVKVILDKAFGVVEAKVRETDTTWDDTIVLPILRALRNSLDIPDGEDNG